MSGSWHCSTPEGIKRISMDTTLERRRTGHELRTGLMERFLPTSTSCGGQDSHGVTGGPWEASVQPPARGRVGPGSWLCLGHLGLEKHQETPEGPGPASSHPHSQQSAPLEPLLSHFRASIPPSFSPVHQSLPGFVFLDLFPVPARLLPDPPEALSPPG